MASGEVARAAEVKLREAFGTFKKVLAGTTEAFQAGLTHKEEPINWAQWRKEISTPEVVDELQALYEKGVPETEKVYLTPELNEHVCMIWERK